MRILLAIVLFAGSTQDASLVGAIDDLVGRIPRAVPAEPADDATFLRRVMKDLVGDAPGEREVAVFEADPDPKKRARKVDELLVDGRFAVLWARRWMEVLFVPLERGRTTGFLPVPGGSSVPCSWPPDATLNAGPATWGDRVTMDLIPGLPRSARTRVVDRFEAWLRDQIRKDRPWGEVLSDMIAARGKTEDRPELAYKLSFFRGQGFPLEFAKGMTKQFFGVRLYCAGCHDHPFDRWTADHFYQTAAFAARERGRAYGTSVVHAELSRADEGEVALPGGGPARPAFLFGGQAGPEEDRMETLARLLGSKPDRQFARALANRIWSWLLGRGIADPVDDFSLRFKPVSVPLLEALARATIENGHSIRFLVRTICATRLYQQAGEDRQDGEFEYFWRGTLRRAIRSRLPVLAPERQPPLPVALELPASWNRVTAKSGVAARWQASPKKSSAPADLYLLSSGAAFDLKNYVERWTRQVGERKTRDETIEGRITLKEVSGRLWCEPGADGPLEFVLLAAVLKSGEQHLLFRFEGPAETIREWRPEFLNLLKSASK